MPRAGSFVTTASREIAGKWRRAGRCDIFTGVRRVAFLLALLALFGGATSAFAQDSLWTPRRADVLLKALRAAGDHGLEPGWYGVADLEKAVASGDDRARTDGLLTDALVAYASDVSTGRVRANGIDANISIDQRKLDKADLLKAAADAPDFAAWLAGLAPKGDYPALQKALAELRARRAATAYTPIPDIAEALRPGKTDARVPILRRRLAELGMTVPPAAGAIDLYDDPLVALVKAYQNTKGLTADGVIGAHTTRSLNTSPDDRIEQVIANLERRRWLPEELGQRYVLVNAGDYSMVFVDGGKPVFQSLVIVGTPKNPTPELSSTMYGFQTNPYWTVPQSIAGEEYLPLLRRDPNALSANGFRLYASFSDDNSEIDPATVDWRAINPKAFPYRLRQDPGASNALGYIFFPFANKYGIYMHDTATRWLFSEGSRNFSHGCIRLQNPLDFVEKVYGSHGFDKKGVQRVIDAGEQHGYAFPESVKLYVTYRTVSVGADGEPVFRDDVYGRDKEVVRAMGKPRS
ncbi:MAG TPA: L,D-transpeptidase family protein [Reyranella sp.]|nr:L,D-transpeptidase family protein [Reyranella sp.]